MLAVGMIRAYSRCEIPAHGRSQCAERESAMTRRDAIKTTVVGTAVGAIALSDVGRWAARAQAAPAFELPPLPYAVDALEP